MASVDRCRVVVTGMGVVSPVGIGVEEFWRSVCGGVSGIREIQKFDTKDFAFTRAGEVDGFALPSGLDLAAGDIDPATQFMIGAAAEAIEQSGLSTDDAQVA